jgi:photosystem II stability/assembly factor-like uncharacterized protein
MIMSRLFSSLFILIVYCTALCQSIPPSAYQELEYRMIGPFRAGRTVGAVGIPTQPNVFFIGVNNGGVWKTDDYGRTWKPIMDNASTGSIGDVAVSPSNPNIIYVGTGEGLHRPDLSTGDGIFKSTDGGVTWTNVGLQDVQQVGRIVVHPTNPNIVFVAGLGHPYGANEERGVFRSIDGGKTWQKVFYIDQNTGAIQVEFDPLNPKTIYADMWEHREGPWENGSFSGAKSGLYKSVDGGTTWKQLTKGLPSATDGLGRIGVGLAPSNSKILYATVDARDKGGIYQSIDAGESWNLITSDSRLWGRGSDFADIRVHPRDPSHVIVANTCAYRSVDGGKTWTAIKGAPGGDDYHRIWINPIQPDVMILALDQGATITVNGGKTWSSWYNQPTAQLYHVSTDNQFPYWVYGGQQESGAMGTASRGPGGQISLRDWTGIGSDEYAYVAADPLNPDLVYGGKLIKWNRKTGQSQSVAPEALRSGNYRMLRTMPLLFHPADPHMMLFATNVLWKTINGGQSWDIISPDLSREHTEVPDNIGDFKTPALNTMNRRGVIYAVAGSPLHAGTIWAGTDDGQVHFTSDGGSHWKNITPASLRSWDKVSQIDASHFNVSTAYISINAIRLHDMKPHIFKTNDGGSNWKEIVNGLPIDGPVNVIREDPKQPGLLYAGTEREVYFSIDDGDHWQSLKNNMPVTSIRDLVVHDNDLVIGTHGRSIWILDNIAPLREMSRSLVSKKTYLYAPPTALRVRDNTFHDTPMPPEEPAGQNPPDGAIIDYHLTANASSVTIEILDANAQLIKKISSKDLPDNLSNTLPYPSYWIKPFQSLGTQAGHHRYIWDLKYAAPGGVPKELSIAAIYKKTPGSPDGPYVHPGIYTIRLTVDGDQIIQKLRVDLDPRITISPADIQQQTDLSMACYNAYNELQVIRENMVLKMSKSNNADSKAAIEKILGSGNPDIPDIDYSYIVKTPVEKESIVGLQSKLLYLMAVLQSADVAPTSQTKLAVSEVLAVAEQIKMKAK